MEECNYLSLKSKHNPHFWVACFVLVLECKDYYANYTLHIACKDARGGIYNLN
jgi:hypothetical protein